MLPTTTTTAPYLSSHCRPSAPLKRLRTLSLQLTAHLTAFVSAFRIVRSLEVWCTTRTSHIPLSSCSVTWNAVGVVIVPSTLPTTATCQRPPSLLLPIITFSHSCKSHLPFVCPRPICPSGDACTLVTLVYRLPASPTRSSAASGTRTDEHTASVSVPPRTQFAVSRTDTPHSQERARRTPTDGQSSPYTVFTSTVPKNSRQFLVTAVRRRSRNVALSTANRTPVVYSDPLPNSARS